MNIIATILCIALFDASSSRVAGWNGIIPLRSSRVDVERILGPSISECRCDYRTTTANVFIIYSGDRCSNGDPKAWNVPRDVVIELTVYPKKEMRFSKTKLDLRKFEKTRDPELQGYTRYSSATEGVTYAVRENGLVYSITWFPSSRDECLRCRVNERPGSQSDTR